VWFGELSVAAGLGLRLRETGDEKMPALPSWQASLGTQGGENVKLLLVASSLGGGGEEGPLVDSPELCSSGVLLSGSVTNNVCVPEPGLLGKPVSSASSSS
jgi:hypothetical protein